MRQAQAVEASYTDYDYGDDSYSQGKLLSPNDFNELRINVANQVQDVSQAASPEPSMAEYQTPPQTQPSYSQAGYTTFTTATTHPTYHQDQYYQQPPTPWQGHGLPYGTTSGFQHLSIDSTSGPAPPDHWQYDSYAYGAEDPFVFTGWNQNQPGPGTPHGGS